MGPALQFISQLGGDHIHMCAAFGRRDRVCERHVLWLSIRQGESDLPSFVDLFIDHGRFGSSCTAGGVCSSLRGRVEIHLNVLRVRLFTCITYLLEILDLYPFFVQEDFDVSHCTRHVIDALHEQGIRIIVDS